MALLFMDSFDYITYPGGSNYDKWYTKPYVGSSFARTGPNGMYAGGSLNCWPSDTTCIVGFGLYCTGWSSLPTITVFSTQSGFGYASLKTAVLEVSNLGEIIVYRGYNAELGRTGRNVIRTLQWHHIEFKVYLADSGGTWDVKVDGTSVLSLSGLDTAGVTGGAWGGLYVQAGYLDENYIDDFYVCDGSGSAPNNNLLGQVRVVCLLPQTDAVGGAGDTQNFTCNTGTDHGALVDEVPNDGDTTYLYSSTLNHVDTWNYPALGYTGTIHGVQMALVAKASAIGTRAIAHVARPASTDRVSTTNHYLGPGSYIHFLKLWENNPEDSAAWEVADIDGAEFGVKVTA